jgi:hypothetical protein
VIGLVEAARRASRALLPKDIYLRCASRYGPAVGRAPAGVCCPSSAAERGHGAVYPGRDSFTRPGLVYPVVVRYGTTDAIVFVNNLVHRSYACIVPRSPPRFLVDAGADAGYASAYFLSAFPASTAGWR